MLIIKSKWTLSLGVSEIRQCEEHVNAARLCAASLLLVNAARSRLSTTTTWRSWAQVRLEPWFTWWTCDFQSSVCVWLNLGLLGELTPAPVHSPRLRQNQRPGLKDFKHRELLHPARFTDRRDSGGSGTSGETVNTCTVQLHLTGGCTDISTTRSTHHHVTVYGNLQQPNFINTTMWKFTHTCVLKVFYTSCVL